jgi:6-phosphogluconolactonase
LPGGSNPSGTSATEFMYTISAGPSPVQSALSLWKIDSNSGSVTPVSTATLGSRGSFLAVDASGRNLFVAGSAAPGPNLDLVKVDPTAGTILSLPAASFHTLPQFLSSGDCCPSAMVVDRSGRFAYVGGLNDGSVHVFSVDQNSGSWTEIAAQNHQSGGEVYALAMDPANRFLYSSNRASTHISAWMRDLNTGMLTPLAGSPFETFGLTSSVSLSADGRYAFVPQYETSNLAVYSVQPDGSLRPAAGPLRGGNAPGYATTDPGNGFVFLLNQGGLGGGSASLQVFKRNANTGNLTPVGSPLGLPFGSRVLRVDPTGKFLYAAGSRLLGFSIEQNSGALIPISGLPSASITDAVIVQQ